MQSNSLPRLNRKNYLIFKIYYYLCRANGDNTFLMYSQQLCLKGFRSCRLSCGYFCFFLFFI